MHSFNRDLLVLSNSSRLSPEELDKQLDCLNTMLYHTENWKTFCSVSELIDINRHRIIRKPYLIERTLRDKNHLPFIFTFNKN